MARVQASNRAIATNRVAVRNVPYSLYYNGVFFPSSVGTTGTVNFFGATKLTVAAWVNMEVPQDDFRALLQLGTDFNSNSSILIGQQTSVGNAYTQLGFGIHDDINAKFSLVETSGLVTKKWYRMIGTWDSALGTNQTHIYINGVSNIGGGYIANDVCTLPITDNFLSFGSNPAFEAFQGNMVVSYIIAGKACTAQEAFNEYFGNVHITGGTLVAEWPTSEGSGTTVIDISGNGNTITLTDVAWTSNTPFKIRPQTSLRQQIT